MNHPALGSPLWCSPRRSKTKTIAEASVLSKDKTGMELLHLTERFCQVVGEGEPGSQATICQILMEPNWASHIFHCSGPFKVLLHVWTPQFESLYLSKALHQLSHTVSSFLFWRVREDEGILFKDPHKGQSGASLPHALMTPEWFIVKFGQLQKGLSDQLCRWRKRQSWKPSVGSAQHDADGGGPGHRTGLRSYWASTQGLWQVLGKWWWKQACPVLSRWPRKKMIMKTIIMTLNITNVYS